MRSTSHSRDQAFAEEGKQSRTRSDLELGVVHKRFEGGVIKQNSGFGRAFESEKVIREVNF